MCNWQLSIGDQSRVIASDNVKRERESEREKKAMLGITRFCNNMNESIGKAEKTNKLQLFLFSLSCDL